MSVEKVYVLDTDDFDLDPAGLLLEQRTTLEWQEAKVTWEEFTGSNQAKAWHPRCIA
jgi:hypothetical protein